MDSAEVRPNRGFDTEEATYILLNSILLMGFYLEHTGWPVGQDIILGFSRV